MNLKVNGKGLHGSIRATASKSMAHRLLICAALSDDPSRIRCETLSEDISATAACLKALGCELTYTGGTFYTIPSSRPEKATLYCKKSSSSLRFLLPITAALGITGRFEMEGSLANRPLSPIYTELEKHGARMSPEGMSPLLLSGKIRGGTYNLRADISSQFISGLLFALPLLEEDSTIILTGKHESDPHTEMTLNALRAYGIKINSTKEGYEIAGKQKYRSPGSLNVEGDWSYGAFWLSAMALGAPITVTGLDQDSLQRDKYILEALKEITCTCPKVLIDAQNIPDLVPILSVVAATQKKTTIIYNAARLKFKESDRIKTTCDFIRAIGAQIFETEDGMRIKGNPEKLRSATVNSAGDHRIAMAAAIASVSAGEITILNSEAVNKSYPSFFEDFRRLGGTVTMVS